jgi:hypothetical protein
MLIGVLVEHDTSRGTCQHFLQLRLALAQRHRPQVLAVELQQVEGVQNRVCRATIKVRQQRQSG